MMATTEPFLATVGGEAGSKRIAALPGPDWLKALRRLALARAGVLGLPTRHNEAWKYTDLAGLPAAGYHPAEPPSGKPPAGPGIRLVNGYITGLPSGLPAGVTIGRLSDPALSGVVEPLLGRVLGYEDKVLAAFNMALFHEGVVVRIGRGVALDQPIEITSCGEGDGVEYHPRLLVVVEEGAAATLIERHRSQGGSFANPLAEIALGQGASLRHYKLEDENLRAVHLATTGVSLGAGAQYEGVVVQTGGRLARHELHAEFVGPCASCSLDGATLGSGSQHLDMTTFVTHRASGGTSRQLFKTVLGGTARGVVLGKIRVEPGAQKTDAYQLSQGLLLSRQAEMDGRPELEIFADDVKCGHGTSVGELDEAALFYLRSRAIGEAEARRLLIEGFLGQSIERIAIAQVRDEAQAVLSARLQGIVAEEEA